MMSKLNYFLVDTDTEDIVGTGVYIAPSADATFAGFESSILARKIFRKVRVAKVGSVCKLDKGYSSTELRELKTFGIDLHTMTHLPKLLPSDTLISDFEYAPDACDVYAICLLKDVGTTPARLPNISEPGTAAATRTEAVVSIRKSAMGPSDAAKLKLMTTTQTPNTHAAIFNGRPLELIGAPISVYHPVFQKFSLAIKLGRADITSEDKRHAYGLILKSAEWYDSKATRQFAIRPHLQHFFGPSTANKSILRSGATTYNVDGYVEVTSPLCPLGILASEFFELRNGLGQGDSDPTHKAAKAHMWASVASELDEIRAVSCLPAFLLSISAAHIAVSGSIFVDGIVTQYLTDFISLVPPSGVSLDDHVDRIAILFAVLRDCLQELKDYYASLRQPPTKLGVLLPAPHFSSFVEIDSGQLYTLTYTKRVFEERKSSKRAVFRATARSTAGSEPIEVIVKFCARYGADGHREVHSAGVAPKLMYCEQDASVGMFCVVMEYVEESNLPGATSDGVKRLRDAVKTMGEEGLAHGDIRDANVIWDSKGQPFIIDFDWSGKVGEVFYPWSLNPDIDWANGVSEGGRIEIEHDVEMMGKLIHDLGLVE